MVNKIPTGLFTAENLLHHPDELDGVVIIPVLDEASSPSPSPSRRALWGRMPLREDLLTTASFAPPLWRGLMALRSHTWRLDYARLNLIMVTIADRLRDAPVGREHYVDFLYNLLDGAIEAAVDDTTFVEAFRFIERNAEADLGTPGPLIHFLERFYPRYCGHLVESVERHPTFYTLWMLNRILNGSVNLHERTDLLSLLARVAASADVHPDLRKEARDFWELHVPRG